ncbi:outer membrane efflux protein [Acetobacter nitrogenifigens DSM 23921 = NBRC 105050]|uniref:Protein CyaE n=1 Tax=Acetobacter nitrogenifigens DSM 23921 = NBRC 105050 TaxID=1120919 RepID=A0A511X7U5_9PROT|nr:TolC family protein [Acetobacter nitrogenifigens]GBQ95973.1 outer membrane efflux protein [Acetobacter nitrogenifigens DSM 23921 = NBRC 105050]GEN59012.1 protein CyaE [Acetobacter nitrogenifigens DSM 23921 = NBRC 105050]
MKALYFRSMASVTLCCLGACATDALQTAPAHPDAPWKPNVSQSGEILPGREHAQGLTLPPGFALPANTAIHPRDASPDITANRAYSLVDLIDIAQSANPFTRRAWNTARDSALAVGIARSSYLPRLSATVVGGYNHTRNNGANPSISNGGVIGDAFNTGASDLRNLTNGVRNNTSGSGEVQTLSIEWLLFDFGKREATIDAAQQAQIASNILFTAAHQKVIYGVSLAFYTHAAAAARVILIREALDNARQVQKAAEARLKQGQGTIVDVTQTQQATAQAELRLVQAEGEVENRYLDLMTAMGVSPDTRLQTQDISNRPLALSDMRMTDAMVRQAVSRRPDVLAAYATVRSAQSRVAAAKAEFLPKIFLTGNVAYSTGGLSLSSVPGVGSDSSPTLNLSTNNFSSLILGGITVPIFDGGTRAALVRQAQNQSDTASVTLRQTIDDSVRQIVAAQNSLRTSLSAYAASDRLQTAASTTFDAAFTAYRSGVGSVTQASLAQNGLFDARLTRSDAYYAALISAASLAFAAGALGNAEDVPMASSMGAP